MLNGAVGALSVLGEGAGRGVGRDVRAERPDAEGHAVQRGGRGPSFSASAISATNKRRDALLKSFCERTQGAVLLSHPGRPLSATVTTTSLPTRRR